MSARQAFTGRLGCILKVANLVQGRGLPFLEHFPTSSQLKWSGGCTSNDTPLWFFKQMVRGTCPVKNTWEWRACRHHYHCKITFGHHKMQQNPRVSGSVTTKTMARGLGRGSEPGRYYIYIYILFLTYSSTPLKAPNFTMDFYWHHLEEKQKTQVPRN